MNIYLIAALAAAGMILAKALVFRWLMAKADRAARDAPAGQNSGPGQDSA